MIFKSIYNQIKCSVQNQQIYSILYIINVMKHQKIETITSLKQLLHQFRQFISVQKQTNFWFGGIISIIEETNTNTLINNLKIQQNGQLCLILNEVVNSMLGFYLADLPQSIYKLFDLYKHVIDINISNSVSSCMDKINFFNNVAIFLIRNKQYVAAMQNYEEAITLFRSRPDDLGNQAMLITYSNFIFFNKKSNTPIKQQEIEQMQYLFSKLIKKYYIYRIPSKNYVSLLVNIYEHNYNILSQFTNQIKNLKKNFDQGQQIELQKKRTPIKLLNQPKIQNFAKSLSFQISVNKHELEFFLKKSLKPKLWNKELQLQKIQSLLTQGLQILVEQDVKPISIPNTRYLKYNLQQKETHNKSLNLPSLTTLNTSQIQKRQITPSISSQKVIVDKSPKRSKFQNQQTIFKYNSIYICFTQQGILFSDYSKTNSKYIQWNTMAHIMHILNYIKVFQDYVKITIQNFYDIVRIICLYLSRSGQGLIQITIKPVQLLLFDHLIQIYQQNGNFLLMVLLNRYNTQRIVGSLDCWVEQFNHYFKRLGQDDYINELNNWIMSGQFSSERTYHLSVIKRKTQASKEQLQSKFKIQIIEACILSQYDYKLILILTQNLNLFMGIKVDEESRILEITFQNLNQNLQEKKFTRTLSIHPYQYQPYFPFAKDKTFTTQVKKYGRTIFSLLSKLKMEQEGLSTNFQVIVHAYKTTTIPYGKYFSRISVQLIGSEILVIGIIVRYYELAFSNQKIALFISSYNDLFKPMISIEKEYKTKILQRLMIDGNVLSTYNWVKKNQKFGKITSLTQYLRINKLIY